MPFYENVFIARQDISAPQVEALSESFAKLLEENGGQVTKREQWGLRPLAFRIRKHRKGHYILFNIDAPATAVHELERQMRISEDVLRYLTIRVDALEEGPSAMMQSRSGRGDERPRRDDRPHGASRPREQAAASFGERSEKPDDGSNNSSFKNGDER